MDTLSEIRFGWVLEEVEGEPLETHLVYDGMPKRYDDFGEKEITMALGDPDDEANPWRYTQPVEVFFVFV